VKVSSSEYLLLPFAAVVEIAVRTITLPNLLLFRSVRWCTCLLVLFKLLLMALALIEDYKFICLWLHNEIKLFSYDLSSHICRPVARI